MNEQLDDRPPRQLKPHRGTLILVFGILGFVVCVIFGIAAWIMGNNDLQEMRSGRMDREGEGITNAGRICGIISVCINVLWILALGGLLAMGFFAAATGT